MSRKVIDLTNRLFGDLLATAVYERRPIGRVGQIHTFRQCQCVCGSLKFYNQNQLRRKQVRSCGHRRPHHGMVGTPAYCSWRSMLQRCYTETKPCNRRAYRDRGIQVCKRWRTAFLNFFADLGPRPPGTTLDRIDPSGHYEPTNCRWATPIEQGVTRRNNVWLTYRRERLHLSEWARRLGVSRQCLHQRYHKYGIKCLEKRQRRYRYKGHYFATPERA